MSLRLIQRLIPINQPLRYSRPNPKHLPYPSPSKYPRVQSQAPRSCHRQFSTRPQRVVYQNSISWTTAIAIAVTIGASIGFVAGFSRAFNESCSSTSLPLPAPREVPTSLMTTSMPPGRPGNLTPDQEEKLQELWQLVLKVFGVADGPLPQAASPNGKTPPPSSLSRTSTSEGSPSVERRKKSRMSFLKKKSRDTDESASDTPTGSMSGTSTPSSVSDIADGMKDDKHGMAKAFRAALAGTSPADIRTAFWDMVKHDHPDALLLRFLRARKWDVNAALVMAISALHWRAEESKVDSDVIFRGEEGMLNLMKSENPEEQKEGGDFMQQIRMGKSFLHGVDKQGRPICYVRVRLHKPGEQSESSLERFTVYTIETARMFLRPPVDTATIVFDMSDFGLANMDYTPVKFMIKCFEANYPESLGAVLVHRAPWVFQGIWRVIKGWLDPVVAGKVHFTNNNDDLGEFIEPSTILKELSGPNNWSYDFKEPIPGENSLMKNEEAKMVVLKERESLSRNYEGVILEWIASAPSTPRSSPPPSATGEAVFRQRRDELAEQLKANYWKLDPYVRARTIYDRTGELKTPSPLGEAAVNNLAKSLSRRTLQPPAGDSGRASIESAAQSFHTSRESWEDDLD